MKRTQTILAGLMLSALFLTNCGGGVSKEVMNADAKKIADVMCKIQKLPEQAIAKGDTTGILASIDKAKKESEDLIKSMESKYTTEADQKAFMKALDSLQAECK